MNAAKEKKERAAKEIETNLNKAEKLMEEVNAPFSHTDPVKKPPTYEKVVNFKEIYPQLPVISQKGNYYITDDDECFPDKQTSRKTGQAETTIKMFPDSKSKKKMAHLKTKGRLRISRFEIGDDGDQSETEGAIGGYDLLVRRLLEKAEKRGDTRWRKKVRGDDSSTESEKGGSDGDLEDDDSSFLRRFLPTVSSTRVEEEIRQALKEVQETIDDCLFHLDQATGLGSCEALRDHLEELQIREKELRRADSEKSDVRYTLRSRKKKTPGKMLPVIVRGQNLEYKPWQTTDMSDILEKLPTLQDEAHPWISKLEEIMIGTQPAIGDIKRLLVNLLGVPAMEEILEKAGLDMRGHQ